MFLVVLNYLTWIFTYILVVAGAWSFIGLGMSMLSKVELPEKFWKQIIFCLAWPITIPAKSFGMCKCN